MTITSPDTALSPPQVEFISNYVYQRSGIVLGPQKQYLIEGRLSSVCRVAGFKSISQLFEELSNQIPQLETLVIDALTTNETSWFRDAKPFSALKKVILLHLAQSRSNKSLKIWCAASSTGQEPYSIAMLLKEMRLFDSWDIAIKATDISQKVLEQAMTAEFSQLEVSRGLPAPYLVKYFKQNGNNWQLKSEITKMVQFSTFRLNSGLYNLGRFDLVFCRNVLIYFDAETRKQILTNIQKTLEPGGLLMIGGSEAIFGLDNLYKQVRIQQAIAYAPAGSYTAWDEVVD